MDAILVGAPGGEWIPSEEPELDEERFSPALLVAIVLIATVFITAAIVVALLVGVVMYAEPREWETIGSDIPFW